MNLLFFCIHFSLEYSSHTKTFLNIAGPDSKLNYFLMLSFWFQENGPTEVKWITKINKWKKREISAYKSLIHVILYLSFENSFGAETNIWTSFPHRIRFGGFSQKKKLVTRCKKRRNSKKKRRENIQMFKLWTHNQKQKSMWLSLSGKCLYSSSIHKTYVYTTFCFRLRIFRAFYFTIIIVRSFFLSSYFFHIHLSIHWRKRKYLHIFTKNIFHKYLHFDGAQGHIWCVQI